MSKKRHSRASSASRLAVKVRVLAESTGNSGGREGLQGTPACNAYGNLLILFARLVDSNPTLSATSSEAHFQGYHAL
jgi:hypothetical protein